MTIHPDKLAFLLKVNAHRQLKSIKEEDAKEKLEKERETEKPKKDLKPPKRKKP